MAQHSYLRHHEADEQQHIDLTAWQRDENMFEYLDTLGQHSPSVQSVIDHFEDVFINEYELIDVRHNDTVVDESFTFDVNLLEHNSDSESEYFSWEMQGITASVNQDLPLPSHDKVFEKSLPASWQSNTSTEDDLDYTADSPTRSEEVEAVFLDLDSDEVPFFVTDSNLHQGINAAAAAVITADITDVESLVAREMFAYIGAWTVE